MLTGQTVTHAGDTHVVHAVQDHTVPGFRGLPVPATMYTLVQPVTRHTVRLVQPARYELGVTEQTHPRVQLPLAPGCEHCALPPGFALCHVTGEHAEPQPVRRAVECALCRPAANRPDPHRPSRQGPDTFARCRCAQGYAMRGVA